ncbi:hypothetical protein ACUZ9N_02320 [Mycoplasmopsis gallinarum]
MLFCSKFKSKPILAKVSFNNKDFNLSTDIRQTKVKEEIKEWIQKNSLFSKIS